MTAFLLAGLVAPAGGYPKPPANVDVVTFTAVKSEKGEKVRVTVGDIAFDVPELELKRSDNIRLFVLAKCGELCTVVPIDPDVPHRTEELRDIAVRGKSYSLPVRQPAPSAYFRQGTR